MKRPSRKSLSLLTGAYLGVSGCAAATSPHYSENLCPVEDGVKVTRYITDEETVTAFLGEEHQYLVTQRMPFPLQHMVIDSDRDGRLDVLELVSGYAVFDAETGKIYINGEEVTEPDLREEFLPYVEHYNSVLGKMRSRNPECFG